MSEAKAASSFCVKQNMMTGVKKDLVFEGSEFKSFSLGEIFVAKKDVA
ncbi:MAG: hypothetical protein V4581_04840 [Bacteroidota bacterium]